MHFISVSIQSETTDKLKAFIENLVKPLTNPISIRAICDKINEHFGDKPSYYQIRRILRKDLAYSYKRGSSRPPKYKDSRLFQRKGVFWVELMKMMQKQLTIYNVVEWSFERSLKQTYSWLPRSKGGSKLTTWT